MPKLMWNGARFELECNRFEGETAQALGFFYDTNKRIYWTGRLDVARYYKNYSDWYAKQRFEQEANQVALSWASDANISIPAPEGKEYLGFQKAGIYYALQRRNTLIADEMGLGKTIQALGVINANPSIKKVLIIPPASLRLNWRKEILRWVVRNMTGGFALEGNFPDASTDIVIINYDIVRRHRKKIDERRWDLLICDEAHYLKNAESLRTKSVLGAESYGKLLSQPIDCGMALYLTGTPILNRPFELWPILRTIDRDGLGVNQWSFVKRYCKAWEAPWGWDFTGHDNLDELQTRLRATVMIRRLKKDVLAELPAKRRQVIAIPNEGAKSAVKAERDFYLKNNQIIEQALTEVEKSQASGDEYSYKVAIQKLKEGKAALFEEMGRLRYNTALAKLPFGIEYIKDLLEDLDKIVVFVYHEDLVERVCKEFGKIAVMMHGGVPVTKRQLAVDRFQEDPNVRIIVGSIGTMGVGWTLTAASYCLFLELDWVPAMLSQSEDRLHRIGQKESVLIQHLVFDESLDSTMAQRIVEKQEVIDAALDK